MRINVEIPVARLDAAAKKLKNDLAKALAKISKLERELAHAQLEVKRVEQMRNDFEDLCDRYSSGNAPC